MFLFGKSKRSEDAEKLKERKDYAQKYIANNRKALQKPISDIEKLSANTWATNGSFASVFLLTSIPCVIISRAFNVAALTTLCGLLPLGATFMFGNVPLALAVNHFTNQAVGIIDNQLKDLKQLDEKFAPLGVKEYGQEIEAITEIRNRLRPDREAMEKALQQQTMSNEEIVDEIIKNFEKRKAAREGRTVE